MMRTLIYLLVAIGSSAVLAGILRRESDAMARVEASPDTVALGRAVYIAEGCIHCHSQYVRPVGKDSALWGAPTPVDAALAQEPVLIGNRRQGPDLANVALRRPREWNRLHLINPQSLMPASRMPSYAHLFESGDTRGPALLDYLDQLQASVEN